MDVRWVLGGCWRVLEGAGGCWRILFIYLPFHRVPSSLLSVWHVAATSSGLLPTPEDHTRVMQSRSKAQNRRVIDYLIRAPSYPGSGHIRNGRSAKCDGNQISATLVALIRGT